MVYWSVLWHSWEVSILWQTYKLSGLLTHTKFIMLTYGLMSLWTHDLMNSWTYGLMELWTYGLMDSWTYIWTHGLMDLYVLLEVNLTWPKCTITIGFPLWLVTTSTTDSMKNGIILWLRTNHYQMLLSLEMPFRSAPCFSPEKNLEHFFSWSDTLWCN